MNRCTYRRSFSKPPHPPYPPQNLRYKTPATFSGKLYRSVVNSVSVCAILWSLKEALDIDLKVTLGVFKHIFSSHAQNEISNRKTLKSQQAFTRVNFSFKFILLSELSISGMEKDECGKLPLKKLIVLSHDTRSISHYMSWNIVRRQV